MPLSGAIPAIGAITCRVTRELAQNIPHNAFTDILYDIERWDTDTIHDLGANTDRLTCFTAGYYIIVLALQWDDVAGGRRLVQIVHSVDATIASHEWENVSAVGYFPEHCISTVWPMNVGEWVKSRVLQRSGVAVDLLKSANHTPEFMMQWLSPL